MVGKRDDKDCSKKNPEKGEKPKPPVLTSAPTLTVTTVSRHQQSTNMDYSNRMQG